MTCPGGQKYLPNRGLEVKKNAPFFVRFYIIYSEWHSQKPHCSFGLFSHLSYWLAKFSEMHQTVTITAQPDKNICGQITATTRTAHNRIKVWERIDVSQDSLKGKTWFLPKSLGWCDKIHNVLKLRQKLNSSCENRPTFRKTDDRFWVTIWTTQD